MAQEVKNMANSNSNKSVVPEAKEALNKFKYEVANEVGVNLKQGYNGDLSSRDAGKIGGQMVRKLIQQAENQMKQFQFRIVVVFYNKKETCLDYIFRQVSFILFYASGSTKP